jgi:predicted Zn-dependent peptidase
VDIGSRDEPAGLEGVSHFIEHMVFKGTATRSPFDLVSYIESVGGMLNAFTSRENTCFLAKVIDSHLPRAVEVLSDLVFNARFDESDIAKEKKIVIDEINEVKDTPSDLVHDIFAESIFRNHSLGKPILGTAKSVKGLSRDKIIEFRDRNYSYKKMLIVASGNLNHEELIELVQKNLPKIPGNDLQIEPRVVPVVHPGLTVKTQKTTQAHICIGSQTVKFDDDLRGAVLLLNAIIGGSMSSKLFQKIREDLGMAYTVFSYLDFFMDASVIGVYLNSDKKYTGPVILNVFDELDKIARDGLTQEEIDSAKEQLKGSLVLGLENTSHRMNRLAKHELLLNRYISIDESINEIDRVTADEVNNLAANLFSPDNYTITILGPLTKSEIKKTINL